MGTRSATTYEEILEAAEVVFSTNGYRGTSLDAIAQQLGITRQALYHYFPRKVDVLIALNRRMIQLFHDKVDEAVAEIATSGENAFTVLVRTHARTVAENVSLVSVFIREATNVPEPEKAELNALRRAYQDRFVAIYRSGVQYGQLRDVDPGVAVNILLGAANHLCYWYSAEGDIPPEKIADVVVDVLRSGFGTVPS